MSGAAAATADTPRTAIADVGPDDFVQWIKTSYGHAGAVPQGEKAAAARLRYVFVNGFLNEAVPTHFNESLATLRALGVPSSQLHHLFPPSVNSVEENARYLAGQLGEIAARGEQKLVVIGHSKGAAESLAAALIAPKGLLERIQAVFLLQGAIRGTAFADYFFGDGKEVDERFPWPLRKAFRWAKNTSPDLILKRLESTIGITLGDGVRSLTRARMEALWKKLVSERGEQARELTGKVFYITSWETQSRLSLPLQVPGLYLTTYYGDNDGLIGTDTQVWAGLGKVLGRLRASHAATVDVKGSTHQHSLRRAMTEALARAAVNIR